MVEIKYYGLESHFNENVTFYKDVNIQGNLNYDSLTVRNLTVTERSILGITTSTSLSAQNLSVSGVSTLGTVQISSGIITATSGIVTYYGDVRANTHSVSGTSTLGAVVASSLVVSGISTLGIATASSLVVSGISTLGTVTATSFVKSSGTSSQYLRADGSSEELTVTYGTNSGNTTYVYPPSGFVIGNLIGFIPSVRTFHYNGTVDSNDSSYCFYTVDTPNARIEVVCYTSEQRATPTNNWLAIWRKTV